MVRQYESVWRCHVAPAFARVPMADVLHAAVQAWLHTKTRPTAEKCVRVLRAVMGQAHIDGCTDNRVMEDRLPHARRDPPAPAPCGAPRTSRVRCPSCAAPTWGACGP